MADKTHREQILELQEQMMKGQALLAKELLDLVAAEIEAKDGIVARLKALHERTIPGTTLDQQVAGMVNQLVQLGQTAGQIYQQLLAQPQ